MVQPEVKLNPRRKETPRGEGLGCSGSLKTVLSIHWAEGNSNTVYVIHGNTGLDRDGELSALSLEPCLPAWHHASHHDDNGLNLCGVSQPTECLPV
ncbi:hypothetical protein LEMLEM_LOCUS15723 [Lemmus lemmus]